MQKHTIALASALLAAVCCAARVTPSHAANGKFTLSSPVMKDGGYVPEKYVGNNPQSKNCSGGNMSLPLAWRDAPADTKSFAITMVDPVPRDGQGFVHWVAYDIPASKTSLKAGEANKPSGFVGGKNSIGLGAWLGPCPLLGDAPHPYTILLIATNIAPGMLEPGLTRDQLLAALQGHVLGVTSFIARYHKL